MTGPNYPPEVIEAWVALYEGVFYEIMLGVINSDPVAEYFSKFSELAKELTKSQMQTIATYSAQYFVKFAKDPQSIPKKKVQPLMAKSIANALERLSHEEKN